MSSMSCSVDGCERRKHAKGMCSMHYLRLKRHGDVGGLEPTRVYGQGDCSFDGCVEPSASRGLCSRHYMRFLRHGDPSVDLKSKPFSPCSMDGCERKVTAYGLCATHRAREIKHGSPDVVLPTSEKGAKNPGWKGDAVSYSGAHRRVYRYRGAASKEACQHCGEPAKQWAYDWADPNQAVELTRGGLRYFSANVNHYLALCVPCHKVWDLAREVNPESSDSDA